MDIKEFKQIREQLEMTQKEMAQLLGFAGEAQTVKNIEGGKRKPGKLAIKLLRFLSSLSKSKATALIEELNRHEAN